MCGGVGARGVSGTWGGSMCGGVGALGGGEWHLRWEHVWGCGALGGTWVRALEVGACVGVWGHLG